MATLGAPVRVSPLIKTTRWAGLFLGILYGTTHFRSLSKKEAIIRVEEAKLEEIRSIERKMLKEKADKKEMDDLAVQIGVRSQ